MADRRQDFQRLTPGLSRRFHNRGQPQGDVAGPQHHDTPARRRVPCALRRDLPSTTSETTTGDLLQRHVVGERPAK